MLDATKVHSYIERFIGKMLNGTNPFQRSISKLLLLLNTHVGMHNKIVLPLFIGNVPSYTVTHQDYDRTTEQLLIFA